MGKESFHQEDVYPSKTLLAEELKDAYEAYQQFLSHLENEYPSMAFSLRYYHDTRSWLGKGTIQKKTIFWLSFWPGYFQVSFFFKQKHVGLLSDESQRLILPENQMKKYPPIVMKIGCHDQLDSLFTVVKEKAEIHDHS